MLRQPMLSAGEKGSRNRHAVREMRTMDIDVFTQPALEILGALQLRVKTVTQEILARPDAVETADRQVVAEVMHLRAGNGYR